MFAGLASNFEPNGNGFDVPSSELISSTRMAANSRSNTRSRIPFTCRSPL